MNTQLKVLLLFNAIMFLIAAVLEWQYYTAHERAEPQTDYSRSDLISIHARTKSPLVDLDELHRSFRKKIPEPVNISLGTSLIPRQGARQAQLVRIRGDGSGGELSNAAVILFCYNRYACNSTTSSVATAAAAKQVQLATEQLSGLTEQPRYMCMSTLYMRECCISWM